MLRLGKGVHNRVATASFMQYGEKAVDILEINVLNRTHLPFQSHVLCVHSHLGAKCKFCAQIWVFLHMQFAFSVSPTCPYATILYHL